ncbi:MAG: tetratricopeptide repeat protein [Armatimonadota bacterium]|nr:tetratricopeptide repeat protein [Armatimonadota bacterium]
MLLIILGGLVMIIPLWYVWDWWTDGVIGGSEAIVLSVILLAVLGQMAAFPNASLRLALFFLILATALLVPFLSNAVSKAADNKLRSDRIAGYRRAIAINPQNTAARLELAQALYATGLLDEAIEELEGAFQISRLTFQESQQLAQWKEEQRLRDTQNVFCPVCNQENERGAETCVRCGTRLGRGFAIDWARSGGPMAAARAWAVAMACVTAFLFTFALRGKQPPNPLLVTAVGFVAWLGFYIVSRRKKKRNL